MKEIIKKRKNIFAITAIFIGIYFIAYPFVNFMIAETGYLPTIIIGIIILIIGDMTLKPFNKN